MHKRMFLYTNCIPVKGIKRSIIIDTQRNSILPIPNDLYDIIISYRGELISKIKTFFDEENHSVIDGYYDFLNSKGLIMHVQSTKEFPPIDLTWKYPGKISNAILDLNMSSSYSISSVVSQLSYLGCKFIQLRIFSLFDIERIRNILKCFDKSRIKGIELLVKFNDTIDNEAWAKLLKDYGRINNLIIHSSPTEKVINEVGSLNFTFLKQKIDSEIHCGNIIGSFITNLKFLSESQKFNSCLNQKISIDKEGI